MSPVALQYNIILLMNPISMAGALKRARGDAPGQKRSSLNKLRQHVNSASHSHLGQIQNHNAVDVDGSDDYEIGVDGGKNHNKNNARQKSTFKPSQQAKKGGLPPDGKQGANLSAPGQKQPPGTVNSQSTQTLINAGAAGGSASQKQLQQNQSLAEVKRMYKTKKFFDEVAGETRTPQITPQTKRELGRINQQYFQPPSVDQEPPSKISLLAQTLMELKKLKFESESLNLKQHNSNTQQNVTSIQPVGGGQRSESSANLAQRSPQGSVSNSLMKKQTMMNATSLDEKNINVKKSSFDGKYRWWIDPNDPLYIRWVLFLLVVNIVWTHITLPVRLSLFTSSVEISMVSKVIDLVVDLLNMIDLVMHFYIPMMDTRGGWNSAYIFERKEVVKDQMKSWFFLDLFANVPYGFVQMTAYPKIYLSLMSIKLARLRKSHGGIKKLVRKLGFGVVTIRFTISVWNLFMMLHLTACIWGTIGQINLETGNYANNWISNSGFQDVTNPLEKYLNNLYWAAATIMTVGYGDIVPTNDDELIVACCVMLFGICLFTYNLSSLAHQFAEIIKTNGQRGEQHQWAIEYLYHTPNLDERLIHKVEQYINANLISKEAEYFHQKISLARQDEDMQEILLYLAPSLKGQLTLFLYRDAIHRIPFLQGRDPQFYLLYLDKLEPVKFQRETVMLKKGTIAQRLYFIVKGRVLNTTFNRIYSDGAVIGETDIIYRTKRRDSFQALDEIVHVLRMDARVLREIMDRFDDIKKDLYEMASSRARSTAENDQNFQKQLINHKEVINNMLEVLKKQEAIEEVKQFERQDSWGNNLDGFQDLPDLIQEAEDGALTHRPNLKQAEKIEVNSLVGRQGDRNNMLQMTENAIDKIDYQQLWKKNNTLEDQRLRKKDELLEIDSQESMGAVEEHNSSDFRFDLRGIKQQTPMPEANNPVTGVIRIEGGPNNNIGRRTEREDGSSIRLDAHILSPSPNEERKQFQVLQTIPGFNSALSSTSHNGTSWMAHQLMYHNPAIANNNYGRDSNLYQSIEQRLARNQQLMEQIIFRTRKSKISLVQHQQRFKDYLDRIALSQHHHLVSEDILETIQRALSGVTKYINILQLLERNLEQPHRHAVDDSIKSMREILKNQDFQAENAERMMDWLADKMTKHKKGQPHQSYIPQTLDQVKQTQPTPGRVQTLTEQKLQARNMEFTIVVENSQNRTALNDQMPTRGVMNMAGSEPSGPLRVKRVSSTIRSPSTSKAAKNADENHEEIQENDDDDSNGLISSQRRLLMPAR